MSTSVVPTLKPKMGFPRRHKYIKYILNSKSSKEMYVLLPDVEIFADIVRQTNLTFDQSIPHSSCMFNLLKLTGITTVR